MSIYLAHNHRMLKADSQRPGRYFGWFYPISNPELLYLTYFTTDFLGTNGGSDTPVVRDQSIPLISIGAKNDVRHTSGTIGSVHTGLPSSFEGLDYVGVRFFGRETFYPDYADTILMNWELPFRSNDKWSVTFRAYYPTHDSIQVQYEDESDVDLYFLNPSVYLQGGYYDPIVYPKFGTGDFMNESYPHKILSTYGQAEEGHPKYWPQSFPGTTLYNGTVYGTYNDPGWPDGSGYPPDPYPPSGRMFYSFGNDQINQENGDQWYYTVIVGHGDGTISIYVNGQRIMNVPFVAIKKLGFYVGAKDFTATARSVLTTGLTHEYMQITEVSVWGNDISINDRMNVPMKTQPIYKKQNGVYVPNEAY